RVQHVLYEATDLLGQGGPRQQYQGVSEPLAAASRPMNSAQELKIAAGSAGAVSALLIGPEAARACYVFAHGAGAGMRHAFMEAIAGGLAERGIATLRYQFPYMEKGSKRPDPLAVAHAVVRAAVAEAGVRCTGLTLIAGGK